ncbi:MAG: hypothetical protein ACN6I6_00860 [bacterium]
MKLLIMAVLVLNSFFHVVAQEPEDLLAREQLIGTSELEKQLLSDLDLRLKLNSLILEVASQVDREHPGLSPWVDGGQLTNIFKEKSEVFAEFYLDRMDSLGPQKKSLFKKAWQQIRWENLVDVFKRSHLGLQTMFKRKGFGIVVAIFMGFVSDYTIPIILSNIGAPWLIPISAVTPYQVLYSMLPQKITELKIRLKVRESLGGRQAYQAYMMQERATREALKAMSEDKILIPISDGGSSQVDALYLRRNNWFKSFINQMGFNNNDFSFTTLKKFIDKEDLADDYIDKISAHPKLKRWQKAAMITTHLQETMNEEARILFRERFDKHFVRIHSFAPWDGFEIWTKRLLRAKSVAEINELMFEVPRGTPTRLILEVWQDIIIPHYATQTSLNYSKYRKLVEDFAQTRATLLSRGEEAWSLTTHQALIKYVGQSLGDKAFSNCQNEGQTVLRFLLAN